MHPAHIPFKAETQSTNIRGAGYQRPGRRLFCNSQRSRFFCVNRFIQLAQKIYRFQVFSASVLVSNPFPWFALIIKIEHGSHSIYAQTIDMVLPQPEQGISYQKIAYLTAPIVEDQRTPLFMLAFTCICIFIEISTVKVTEGCPIFREMRWHPI